MRQARINRRGFLSGAVAMAAGTALTPGCVTAPGRRSATDAVVLGRTGIRTSRLGIGLGSSSGNVQRNLGKEGFNRLVRDAYDRGLRYLDCAQSYKTFEWLGEAIKDFPRDELFLVSKISGNPEKPGELIDRQLKVLGTDHIDCLMLHCAVTPTWPEERARLMEAIDAAKAQGKVRAKGISCHSLPALRVAAASDWVEINLVRVNPQARHTDSEVPRWDAPGTAIEPVLEQLGVMKKNGHGVIGMKLIGDGDFRDPEDRERAIRFAMSRSEIDAVTIGFKSAAEIDEALARMNRALAE